jgi:hypothetical protein
MNGNGAARVREVKAAQHQFYFPNFPNVLAREIWT